MKKTIGILTALMVLVVSAYAIKVDSTMYVYLEDAAQNIIWSGDSLSVGNNGVLDIKSGGAFKIAGTQVTATAAELNAVAGGVSRSEITEDALAAYHIPLGQFYNCLNGTGMASLDKMDGTGAYVAQSTAANNSTDTTNVVIQFRLPAEYVAAGDVQFTCYSRYAGTGVVGATKTFDVVAKEVTQSTGALGADICATAVKTLTNAFAAETFTITATSLVAGDLIELTITTELQETGGMADLKAEILSPKMLLDIQG